MANYDVMSQYIYFSNSKKIAPALTRASFCIYVHLKYTIYSICHSLNHSFLHCYCIILIYHFYYLATCWTIMMEDKMHIQVHNTFLNIFLKPLLKSVENEMPLVKIISSSNDSFYQFDGAQKTASSSSAGISSHRTHIFSHQTLFRKGERFLANTHLFSKAWGLLTWISYFCSKQRISVHMELWKLLICAGNHQLLEKSQPVLIWCLVWPSLTMCFRQKYFRTSLSHQAEI